MVLGYFPDIQRHPLEVRGKAIGIRQPTRLTINIHSYFVQKIAASTTATTLIYLNLSDL